MSETKSSGIRSLTGFKPRERRSRRSYTDAQKQKYYERLLRIMDAKAPSAYLDQLYQQDIKNKSFDDVAYCLANRSAIWPGFVGCETESKHGGLPLALAASRGSSVYQDDIRKITPGMTADDFVRQLVSDMANQTNTYDSQKTRWGTNAEFRKSHVPRRYREDLSLLQRLAGGLKSESK
jgi:hypothetical protein